MMFEELLFFVSVYWVLSMVGLVVRCFVMICWVVGGGGIGGKFVSVVSFFFVRLGEVVVGLGDWMVR